MTRRLNRVRKFGWALLLFAMLGMSAGAIADTNKSGTGGIDRTSLTRALEPARQLPRLRSVIVAHQGKVVFERAFQGPGLSVPVNVKSVSKTIISALVGIAIERRALNGFDQKIISVLNGKAPANPDPRLAQVTLGNLLSMQAGLERTSGRNYGRWVASRDWVRFALSRPFVEPPGGLMLYSTGNSHMLSAILTKATGRNTAALAKAWLGKPLNIRIPAWQKDPQGIYLGGNNMLLSPKALLRFGEMYRNGGRLDGKQIVPERWVRQSWTPRTRSRFSGDPYGYGWFIAEICGAHAPYARGFGGQFVYVIPDHQLTVVITSDPNVVSWVGGYRHALRAMLAGIVSATPRSSDAKGLLAGFDDSHIPPSDRLGRIGTYNEACPA